MTLRQAELQPYALPLLEPWHSGQGHFHERWGWLVRISDTAGREGYGDAAPLPAAGTESPTETERQLRAWLPLLSGRATGEALAGLPAATATPAARCAVETALLDLTAQRSGVPLARWLNPAAPSTVQVAANLGDLDGAPNRLATALARGFTVLKVKVGLMPAAVAVEIAQIKRLAAQLPTGVMLRLDANRSWDLTAARAMLTACADLPVEMIEEPLRRDLLDQLAGLQHETAIPLALDESLADDDPHALLAAAPTRRVMLKPTLLGGPLAAWHLALAARSAGVEPLVTTAVESAAGVWAAAQLAAALATPLAHGLDTSAWLAEDNGAPPVVAHGRLSLPDRPGLGFRPYAAEEQS